MSTWVTPISWSNGPVSASQMNSLRDNLNWLRGFADLITEGTADTGTATYLHLTRALALEPVLVGRVTADVNDRFQLYAGGDHRYGDGTNAPDIRIARAGVGILNVDASFLAVAASAAKVNAVGGTAGYGTGFAAWLSGDAAGRAALVVDASGKGALQFGSGAAAADAVIYRNATGSLTFANTLARMERTTATDGAIAAMVTTDVYARWAVLANGEQQWGSGSAARDTLLYRNGGNQLYTPDDLVSGGLIGTMVKAGAFTDSDFAGGVFNSPLGVDQTNGRIYFRYLGAWHYVNQTAGFEIPIGETDCPACGKAMQRGEAVAGILNGYKPDGGLHGLWKHAACPDSLEYDTTEDETVRRTKPRTRKR